MSRPTGRSIVLLVTLYPLAKFSLALSLSIKRRIRAEVQRAAVDVQRAALAEKVRRYPAASVQRAAVEIQHGGVEHFQVGSGGYDCAARHVDRHWALDEQSVRIQQKPVKGRRRR